MKGIRKVCGATKGLMGYYSPEYLELFYDRSSGEVWTVYQYSLGHSTWTQYDDEDIIKISNLSSAKTMQEIADMISDQCSLLDIWQQNIHREIQEENNG